MSEATTEPTYELDEQAEQEFQSLLQQLLGGAGQSVQYDQALMDRGAHLGEHVNAVLDQLGIHGEGGNPDGYTVHFTSEQTRWLLSAIGDFVCNQVPDNAHNAGTTLLDAAEVLVSAVNG